MMSGPLHAGIVGFVNALLQLVVSFGVNVTANQDASITVVVNSLLVLTAVLWRVNGGHKNAPGP
jgi:hypothetical protein